MCPKIIFGVISLKLINYLVLDVWIHLYQFKYYLINTDGKYQ